MYIRPENKIKVPENYGGNAFRGGAYSDIPPKDIKREQPPVDPQETPSDTDSDNSRIDTSYENAEVTRHETFTSHPFPAPLPAPVPTEEAKSDEETKAVNSTPAVRNSLFSSLLPPGMISSHFPFGHGIGTEELIILGMMLMVYLSNDEGQEVDGELIMLLAILLFAG